MIRHLSNFDPAAGDCLETNQDVFRSLLGGESFTALEQQMDRFAFDDALAGLQEAARRERIPPRMSTTPSTPSSRILIVEDTPANIQVLAATLKERGYQISVATNGQQALEVVARVQPDLILLDVMMPEMDGFETCRRLKASQQWQQIPVIFLTAKTDTADIVKGFELGAVDYVGKPFNAHELLARVNTHLTIDRLHRENEKLLLESVRSFEDLRAAQARLLLNETAASQGRLAAVLSHELNSPIASLRSAVESLVQLYKKKREPDETRLAGIFETLAHTALESCQRLKELVARMQRFTNLDRAEEQTVDVNELLRDTIGLLQSELKERAEVVLDLKPLSPLKCRPQQLSAVFLNLLRNAVAHLEEKGQNLCYEHSIRRGNRNPSA